METGEHKVNQTDHHVQAVIFASSAFFNFSIPLTLYFAWRKSNPVIAKIGKKVVTTQVILLCLFMVVLVADAVMVLREEIEFYRAILILLLPILFSFFVSALRLTVILLKKYQNPHFVII